MVPVVQLQELLNLTFSQLVQEDFPHMHDALFQPLQMGALHAKNRIHMAPLTRGRAAEPILVPNELMATYYRQRAGAGMILTEATGISREGLGWPSAPGIWSDEQTEAWKATTKAVHEEGGLIVMQLWHMGRASHSSYQPNGELPVAPSAIAIEGELAHTPTGKMPYEVPRALETAEIAIRAALTGHLVFSTLHTNDAVGGITRLLDMGVEPFLVASAVRAFLAQRLVRRLCPVCKAPAQPGDYSPAYLRSIGFPPDYEPKIMRAVGCESCRMSGYEGRLAIVEICMVTPKLQEMITQRKTAADLRPAAEKEGMRPLRKYGFDKVASGQTTIEEVMRVTTADLSALDE
jgi:hypothetical protein